MLWKRIATAAVLLPLLVGVVLCSPGRPQEWPFLVVCLFAAGLCAYEFLRMFVRGTRDLAGGIALAVLVFLAGTFLHPVLAFPAVLLFVVLAAFHALPGGGGAEEKWRRAAALVFGAIYVGGLFAMYPRTMALPAGEHWVLLGILTVASGDTLAYFTGKTLGRTKLAPALSPNKTVEGAAGGLAGSIACSVAYAYFFQPAVSAGYAAFMGAMIGIFGQGGDLFESLLKRAAGVKDSGTVFPGHGGIFDRVDAVLAAGPVLYLLAMAAAFVEAWG